MKKDNFPLTRLYVSFLEKQKGLSKNTIRCHVYQTEKFLRFLGCAKADKSIPTFGIADIDRFIESEANRLKRTSLQKLANCLRSFIRFLYQTGKISTDLSSLVTSPRIYRLETVHQTLNWSEVQEILNCIDQTTKIGKRDYAILVLLSIYGLRAGEIARLKLENINWRKETIYIAPGKTGQDLWLPLMPLAGKAILKYLKQARPLSKYREIFLLSRAPWTPLHSRNISICVKRYLQHVKPEQQQGGAHLFRHTFATYLAQQGVSLKYIGDLLGHRSCETTQIYTKTNIPYLREVALEVPFMKGEETK